MERSLNILFAAAYTLCTIHGGLIMFRSLITERLTWKYKVYTPNVSFLLFFVTVGYVVVVNYQLQLWLLNLITLLLSYLNIFDISTSADNETSILDLKPINMWSNT